MRKKCSFDLEKKTEFPKELQSTIEYGGHKIVRDDASTAFLITRYSRKLRTSRVITAGVCYRF